MSGICYILDCISLKNKKLNSYKLQKVSVNFDKYHKTIKNVFINQILSFPFIFILYPVISYIGNDMTFIIPSIYNICKYLLLTLSVFDVIFYIGHVLGHKIYLTIHRKHHEWKSPVGVAAHYNHIYEHILLNVIAPSISAVIVKSNATIMLLWIFISTLSVVATHSGYSFFGASKHDIHHELYKYNYGLFFTDYLFNTHYRKK
jgi:methylsterol monooxygenase